MSVLQQAFERKRDAGGEHEVCSGSGFRCGLRTRMAPQVE